MMGNLIENIEKIVAEADENEKPVVSVEAIKNALWESIPDDQIEYTKKLFRVKQIVDNLTDSEQTECSTTILKAEIIHGLV